MNLDGKHILITGGSLGIGKETARLLAEAGAKVAITGRSRERLEKQAAALGAHPICADVGKPEDIQRTFAEFLERFGSLDCLINNAAIGGHARLLDLSEETMRRVWEVNVLGPTLMTKYAAALFIKQNRGDVVNIASTAALKGYEGGSAYSSSKFALKSLGECWRAELRPHNVRVFTVYPSEVTTAFGKSDRIESPEKANRLRPLEIAHAIKAALEMDDRGFIPDLTVFATNPW